MNQKSYIGEQINNYRIEAEIARGGFGVVYRGSHLHFQRTVAIKLLDMQRHFSGEEQEQFRQEAKLLEQLKHPHILPLHDFGIAQGDLPAYLITEFAPNGSLARRLKLSDTMLSLDEILTMLSQIGKALSYAHAHNIIHRDLKPDNILFNEKGEALLADFGIAVVLDADRTKQVGGAGTPPYMAPEQFGGLINPQSDQYALGVIAYELVT